MPGFTLLSASWNTPSGSFLSARLDALEGAVDDAFGDRLLAVEHDAEFMNFDRTTIPELGIGQDFALFWAATTGHSDIPFSSA